MKIFFKNLHPRIKISLIFAITVLVFFLIDWMTKYAVYDAKDGFHNLTSSSDHYIQKDYALFGTRSWPHNNSTIFSSFNVELPLWARHLINFSLASIFAIAIFWVKKTYVAVAMGIMFAGIMGNGLDTLFVKGHYVRDIIYIPWIKNGNAGTFNLADCFVVIGSITLLLVSIREIFKKPNTK